MRTHHNQLRTHHNQLRTHHNQLRPHHNQLRTHHNQDRGANIEKVVQPVERMEAGGENPEKETGPEQQRFSIFSLCSDETPIVANISEERKLDDDDDEDKDLMHSEEGEGGEARHLVEALLSLGGIGKP